VRGFVESEAGANLLAAHRRAVNILRIEEKRDGHPFDTGYEAHLLKLPEEAALAATLEEAGTRIRLDIEAEDFERAMEAMAGLRAPVDAFFRKSDRERSRAGTSPQWSAIARPTSCRHGCRGGFLQN